MTKTQPDEKFKPVMTANLPEAIKFAFGLPTAMMHLTAIDPNSKRPIVGKSFNKTASGEAAALKWITQASNGGYGIYFNINEVAPALGPGRAKASEADISKVYALHVDVDPPGGTTADKLGEVREKMLARINATNPSLVVNSGNGYGVFYFLDEPVAVSDNNLAALKGRNKALADQLGGDSCYDLCRVMRLPNTINLPNAKKRKAGRVTVLASVVSDERDFTSYKLADFATAAVSNEIAEKPREIGIDEDIPDSVDLSKLDAELRALIVDGAKAGDDRSKVVYEVACALRREGWSDGDIIFVLINEIRFDDDKGIFVPSISKGKASDPDADKRYRVVIDKVKELVERGINVSSSANASGQTPKSVADSLKGVISNIDPKEVAGYMKRAEDLGELVYVKGYGKTKAGYAVPEVPTAEDAAAEFVEDGEGDAL